MSPDFAEVRNPAVRRFLAAFETDTEAFRDTLHPEIEWYPIEEDRTRTYGIDAAVRNRDEWLETWEEHRFDLEEAIEDGDDVVRCLRITARGKSGGVEVDVRFYPQMRLRDGKIAYIYDHEDRDATLEAAGLRA